MNNTPKRRHQKPPSDFNEAMNRAARLLQAGKARKALAYCLQAYQLSPDDVDAAINLGGTYVMLNRHKQAIPILERAAVLAPENSKVWINLGAAYLGNPILATPEKQAQAIEAFERSLALDPAAPSVNYNLGLIYRDQGKLEKALAQFRRAAAINPFDQDARKLAGQLERSLAERPASDEPSNGVGHEQL